MSVVDFREILSRKVPEPAVDYCVDLWEEKPFSFIVTNKRQSKLGDYRYDPRNKSHQITVNYDLNPYQFLITYVHEVAHRRVHNPKKRLPPHGLHWKLEFQRLMLPLLNNDVFPDSVLRPLANHMKNPKASTAADPVLLSALAQFDDTPPGIRLVDLDIGEKFMLKYRIFQIIEKKRTRALCLDLENKKRYLIPMVAEVERLEKP